MAVSVKSVSWESAAGELLAVRRTVFVEEQGVPEEEELDEHDAVSLHFLALDGEGRAVGTARLLPCGRIGRVAVLSEWRRRGVGRDLMEAAIASARARGDRLLRLHAQVHSLPFYESLGFIASGDEFDEAGIPHWDMCRDLSAE